jgi:hypothetical protein
VGRSSTEHIAGSPERKKSTPALIRRAGASSEPRVSESVSPSRAKQLAREQERTFKGNPHAPSAKEEAQRELLEEGSSEEEAPPPSKIEQEQLEASRR